MKRHYPYIFDAGMNVLISRRGDCKTPTLLNVIIVVFELI